MGLKAIFKTMKQEEDSIIKQLDNFLMTNKEESDRAINVNSPSQAGKCMRANYWLRTGGQSDGLIEPRTQRIFDNGTYTHERLQKYLKDCGVLLFDEVPILDEEYNIQGHTDGVLKLEGFNLGILEIKSINSNGFNSLKDAKEEHKLQAMVYLYATEKRRQHLRDTYKSSEAFRKSIIKRRNYYKSRYDHLKDGKKFTKAEKVGFQVKMNMDFDKLLFEQKLPIDTIVFLYENKDNQDLKEFRVKYNEEMIDNILHRYETLNNHVEEGTLPGREGRGKSDFMCKYCNYKIECWV